MCTMFSCLQVAAVRASRSKRRTMRSSPMKSFFSSLMATGRSSDFWTALYTFAMPPVPSSPSIRYSSFSCLDIRDGLLSGEQRSTVRKLNHDGGNVVPASAHVGHVDQGLRGGNRGHAPQDGGDLRVGQHVGQAVGAEEEPVARAYRQGRNVDLDLAVDPDGAGDHVPVGAPARFFPGEPAGAHLLRHEGVVVCQLLESASPEAVGPAVAHVRQIGRALPDDDGGGGGAHAPPGGSAPRFFKNPPVCERDRGAEGAHFPRLVAGNAVGWRVVLSGAEPFRRFPQ